MRPYVKHTRCDTVFYIRVNKNWTWCVNHLFVECHDDTATENVRSYNCNAA